MATLRMDTLVLLYLRLESMGITVFDRVHSGLSLFVTLMIGAVCTLALRPTTEPRSKAIAIELKALRFFAIASGSSA